MKLLLAAAIAIILPVTAMAEASVPRVAPAVLTITDGQPIVATDYAQEARFGRRGGRRGFGRRGFSRRGFGRGGFSRRGFGRNGFGVRGFGRGKFVGRGFNTRGFGGRRFN